MASTADKITDTRNGTRPVTASVTTGRTAGDNSLVCDNLTGWPTASKIHFVTYQIDTNSNPVVGTQLDCSGIVAGNTVTSLVVEDGNDLGNAINDKVEMLPTSKWGQDLADAATEEHDRTGKHTDVNAATVDVSGEATVGGTLTANGPLIGINPSKFPNPYKFSVYRAAPWTSANDLATPLIMDTKLYDTGANFDTTTGRFTAPIDGFYQFNACFRVQIGSGNAFAAYLLKNGVTVNLGTGAVNGNVQFDCSGSVSVSLKLVAGDYVQPGFYGSLGTGRVGSVNTYFTGFLDSEA